MSSKPASVPNYHAFQHRCVADLAWCIFSPTLVDDQDSHHDCFQPSLNPTNLALLQQLDNNPTPLTEWLAAGTSTRLGFVFERYWQFWLKRSNPELDWRFNVQVNGGGRTLGEVDALSQHSHSESLHHYEMAVKFYLGLPPTIQLRNREQDYEWVGPQVIDRLHRKWQQMSQQQLTTCSRHKKLLSLPPSFSLHSHAIVRGRLFTPYFVPDVMEYDKYISTVHLKARWLHLKDWHKLPDGPWRLLNRSDWFAPLHGADDSGLLDNRQAAHALNRHFLQYHQPIQVIRVNLCQKSNGWTESERLFIVADGWPSQLNAP